MQRPGGGSPGAREGLSARRVSRPKLKTVVCCFMLLFSNGRSDEARFSGGLGRGRGGDMVRVCLEQIARHGKSTEGSRGPRGRSSEGLCCRPVKGRRPHGPREWLGRGGGRGCDKCFGGTNGENVRMGRMVQRKEAPCQGGVCAKMVPFPKIRNHRKRSDPSADERGA